MIYYFQREKTLLRREEFNDSNQEGVSIITCTNKSEYIDNIFINYENQSYQNKDLMIILNNNSLSIEKYRKKALKYPNVKVCKIDEKISMGYCLNFGVENSQLPYIAKMDDDDYYAPNYILDAVNVFKYTSADITGKLSYFVYFEETDTLGIFSPENDNRYTNIVAGATLLIKRNVFNKVKFKNIFGAGEDSQFISDCVKEGFRIYSSDIFNYVYMKHKYLSMHTWKISTNEYIRSCKLIKHIEDFKKIITL